MRVTAVARRVSDRPPLVVGALFLLSSALAAFFATKITTFQFDELGYTHMAIAISESPAQLTTEFGGGGRLNQLYPLTIAPIYGLFGNVTAYAVTHWWNAILMGSAVIPVYLLAREVLARRSGAYLAAAVAAVVPWLTLSSGHLTEVAAYPACAWALFAMQRALVRPSWRADLGAIAAIAIAAFGRLQLGVLGPVFVTAVVLHELGWALTGGAVAGGRAQALREARTRLLRAHVVLTAATALAAVTLAALLAVGGLQAAFGYYSNTLGGQLFPPGIWSNARNNLTALTWGLGVLPVVLTFGLVLENVWASRERRVHAYAVLAALTMVAILMTVARVNASLLGGVVQERYVMFVVPVLVVGLLAGLFESRRPAVTLLLGAAVVAPIVATTEFVLTPSSFWFLVSPGITWFLEVVAARLGSVAGVLGDTSLSRFAIGGWAIAIGGLMLALALRAGSRRRELVAGSVVVLVFAYCAITTVYSFNRVVNGSAEYVGLGSGTVLAADGGSIRTPGAAGVGAARRVPERNQADVLSGHDWIDRAVGQDAPVSLLATQIGQASGSREQWALVEFWNRAVTASYLLGSTPTTWHSGRDTGVRRDGRVLMPGAARYVVASTRGLPVGLVGRELARSPSGALRLVDTGDAPARAAWVLRGVSDDGWLDVQRPATLTIPASRRGCSGVRFELALPDGLPEPRRLRVTGANLDRRVVVYPREARVVRLRACGKGALRLRLSPTVPATATTPGATIQVRSVVVAAA